MISAIGLGFRVYGLGFGKSHTTLIKPQEVQELEDKTPNEPYLGPHLGLNIPSLPRVHDIFFTPWEGGETACCSSSPPYPPAIMDRNVSGVQSNYYVLHPKPRTSWRWLSVYPA